MKILIAGGTGFIGSAVVDKLKNLNHDVTILSRKASGPGFLQGDVTKPETLNHTWDFDVVVQCVQFPNHPVQNYSKGWTYEKVDGEGTENLCRAIKDSKIKRIIYLSGAGVSPEKTEPWFKAKLRGEKAVKETGKEYVILRPSWVYGPGDRSMSKFIAFGKHLPIMPVIGDGKSRVSPLFIEDLAECVVTSIEGESTKNKTVELGGPQIFSMNEIQQTVLIALKSRKPLVHHPLWMMKLVGDMASILPTPPLSREAVDFITMDHPVDSSLAEKLFGLKFTPLAAGIQTMLEK